MHAHRFTTAADAVAYATAGKATITLVSVRTGARFTYRLSAPKPADDGTIGDIRFVALLSGADNTSDFQYMGFIGREGAYLHGRKSRIGQDAPSAVAFAWVWERLQAGTLPASVEVWHEGSCGRCGRKLTVPESIVAGIGPECASKL